MEILKDIYLVSGSAGFGYGHFADCNVYLINTGKDLVLIDSGAGIDINPIMKNIVYHNFNVEKIAWIFNTHCHFDHVGGNRRIKELSNCKIVMQELGAEAIEKGDVERTYSNLVNLQLEKAQVDIRFKDNYELKIGEYTFKFIHTPGHSPDSTCIQMKYGDNTALFSGDTVLSFGRPALINPLKVDFIAYIKSLEKIVKLNVDMLFPGHEIFVLSEAHGHVELLHKKMSNPWSDIIPYPAHPFTAVAAIKRKMKL